MKKLLFKNKIYLLIILSLIIAEPALASVLNFWLQKLFTEAQIDADKLPVLRLLTIGFLLWIVKRVISFCSGVFKAKYICSCKEDVKSSLFKSVVGIDTANLTSCSSSGEYISIFTNDINILENRFFSQLISLVSNIFSVAILGSSFIALNRTLAFAIIAFGLITMFIPAIFSNSLNRKNLKYSEDVSHLTQTLKEYIVAYPTVKNYSIEHIILKKFQSKNTQAENSKFQSEYTLNLANSVGALLSWFMQFIAVGIGLMLVIKGEIVIGTVIAAQGFAGDLAMPLQSIVSNFNSIYSVREIVTKLERMCDFSTESQDDYSQDSFDIFNEKGDIDVAFQNFHLEMDNKMIISDFSFEFKKGKKYLIIGANGSGKSTLFKTLKKWHNKYAGTISVQGIDIRSLSSKTLSRYVSYMNENVSLFSGSVKDNITLFRSYYPDLLKKAASSAQINLNLHRVIGDEGRNISSGEQRRIEIARSLLFDVNILIFDEVISTLDIKTAFEIEKLALDFEDKTVIFISHNFSGKLINRYDEILLMDSGKLIAHGTYEQLLQSSPQFKELCEIKFG